MVFVQRYFAVALTLVLALVLAYSVGGVDWNAQLRGDQTAWQTVALILAAGAVVASGPISYMFNAPDFVRYLPANTRSRPLVWTVALSSGLIALFLSVMGCAASRGDMSDPSVVGSRSASWFAYILRGLGGSMRTTGPILSGCPIGGFPLRRPGPRPRPLVSRRCPYISF